MIAYKLLRQRRNGTLGPLFINRKQVIPLGQWLQAECHPTRGYSVREGWHALPQPNAPHLTTRNRVWCMVEVEGCETHKRPATQGGVWLICREMRVLRAP